MHADLGTLQLAKCLLNSQAIAGVQGRLSTDYVTLTWQLLWQTVWLQF